MATLEKAIVIAAQAHQNQKDKAGEPYILHPLRMMVKMDSQVEKLVAVLHDVVEDSDWTFEQLSREGFAEQVVEAVKYLTRGEDEDYVAFIERIQGNRLAIKVKLADLEDNMDIRRTSRLSEADFDRFKKYHRAWRILKDIEGSGRTG